MLGSFRFERLGAGGEVGFDHVGEDDARLGHVDIDDGGLHLVERLPTPQ